MKKLIPALGVAVLILILATTQSYAASPSVLFQDKILSVKNIKTEISVASSNKVTAKFVIPGQDISIRDFFKTLDEQVTWDNQNKKVVVKNNGKELVIPFTGEFAKKDNQVILPNGWAYLKNGKSYLRFPYFAYVFDRYGDYKIGSEEYQWRENLSFLSIEYIDTNNSSPKDHMLHSFVMIKN